MWFDCQKSMSHFDAKGGGFCAIMMQDKIVLVAVMMLEI
jgi:hypothetical protein